MSGGELDQPLASDGPGDPAAEAAPPEDDGPSNERIISVIMDDGDPMAAARDLFQRHLGMTVGASMVATGVYVSYAWGGRWLWWALAAMWAFCLFHGVAYLVKRRKVGPPRPGYRVIEENAPGDPEAAPPDAASLDQGRLVQPPRHKITVFEPKKGDGAK